MTMKNGFSTINRLLGKQRDPSNNLSKSTTNLSVTKSTVNINDSSQLHQNRITPLPIATSNAPFEQTFRITVLLPRDQLYVARLGARVRLEKLLQLVCENKQLDPDKYEFQHPADPSQIFSCDQTIGTVGLSEIRLCNKTSDYNNTLRVDGDNSSSRRNSFSSSKFSRNSKNISNTPSLYSSNYSLNSMGSSGVDSSNFRNISPEVATKPMAPVVPTRKKRLAPRPPSQNLSVFQKQSSETSFNSEISKTDVPLSASSSSSTPDPSALEQSMLDIAHDERKSNISIDCNGNTKGSLQHNKTCSEQCQETQKEVMLKSRSTLCIATSEDYSLNAHSSQPAPSPRRRVQTLPKKPALPAPSRMTSRTSVENIQEMQPEEKVSTLLQECPSSTPKSASPEPLEQVALYSKNVSRVFMNQSPMQESRMFLESTEQVALETKELIVDNKSNELVAKVETSIEMKSPTVDPNKLGPIFDKEPTDPMEPIELEQKELLPSNGDNETSEPSYESAPSTPIFDSKHQSLVESSSEDEEAIKVYDLKLGKTIVKNLSNHKTAPELIETSASLKSSSTKPLSEKVFMTDLVHSTDVSIVKGNISVAAQKINRSVLENESTTRPVESSIPQESRQKEVILESLIVEGKLSNGQEKEKQITIEKQKEEEKIEEPLQLIPEESIQTQEKETIEEIKGNKNVESLSIQLQLQEPQEYQTSRAGSSPSPEVTHKQESKDTPPSTESPGKQKPLISTLERLGADEELVFKQHMRAAELEIELLHEMAKQSPPTRSSSFLSLSPFESAKNQRNQSATEEYFNRGRRRSSSELSIGESPSLQSIGVMKSILLNSRKSSSDESTKSRKPLPTECDIQSMEEPSPKNNNILITNSTTTTITNKSTPRSEEKIYRYSGPPNIQFSTWSERPKIQVAIKNEQDCIVDGSKNNQKPISNGRTDLTLQRNGQSLNSAGSVSDLVRSTEKVKLRDVQSENSFETETPNVRPKFSVGSRTSWSVTMTPTSTIGNGSSLVQNNRSQLRPISMIQNTSTNHINNNSQPVFGQGTLRKTGFKEKIVPTQDSEVDGSKPIIPAFTLKNQTKPQITPKTPTRTETSSFIAAVPPPPPPIIRAVLTKQKTNRPQMERSISVDPRDQLLSAIRNFKRDELKNANNI